MGHLNIIMYEFCLPFFVRYPLSRLLPIITMKTRIIFIIILILVVMGIIE